MKLHLIRHGMTEANKLLLYYGSTDVPISEEGIDMLLEMKKRFIYPDASGCRLVTSGMLRAEQTFKLIYGDLPHERIDALREMDFGAFEMLSYDQLKDRDDYREWVSGNVLKNRCPEGESYEDVVKRVLPVLKELLSGKDAIVVSHGGVIAGIMERLFPNEGKKIFQWRPDSGEGYTVEVSGETPKRYFALPRKRE